VYFSRGLVEEGERLARRVGVALQVVVGAVGDAHQLAPLLAGEAEAVLHVDRAGGVVRAVLLGNVEPRMFAGSTPRSTNQFQHASTQCSNHSCASAGG
jgi:hypothetical protein